MDLRAPRRSLWKLYSVADDRRNRPGALEDLLLLVRPEARVDR
jgi:hypothetical protein